MSKLYSSFEFMKIHLDISVNATINIYQHKNMHKDNRYQTTASLFMLREIKRRQEQVNRGYQLLKRKSEALRITGRQVAAELSATQAVLGHTLKEAYICLAAVKFTNGESNALVLENIGQAQIRVERVTDNISGVPIVSLQPLEETGAGDVTQYAGLGAGGHRTAEAKKAFRQAVRTLIKFASLRNTCILLNESIRSTLRKVNGIEKVIMPKLRNTEKYITTEMDEMEREEFHRLKMVKAKKIRAQTLAHLRMENGNAVNKAGDSESMRSREVTKIRSIECLTSLLYTTTPFFLPTDCDAQIANFNNSEDDDLLF